MGRPTGAAWRPLGLDEDPTPGDPRRVTDEAGHLNSVAAAILSQISALQKIAGGGGDQLMGQYADKIRESAGDLVLRSAVNRRPRPRPGENVLVSVVRTGRNGGSS